MNVLLFGPPGSGKGTQAAEVAAKLGIPHVATGDIFRKHLREGTELGKLARSFMDKGQLVPDSVTCDLVASRLVEDDALQGALLDGFPRSVPQAEWLLGWWRERGTGIGRVLNLVVADEAIVERLAGRRSCMNCGATYHVRTAPPAPDGTCKKCGAEVVQRKDDADETIRERLAVYNAQTAAVLPLLRAAGPVSDLDGLGTIDEVRTRIAAALA